jgi:hypothetical protein
MKNPGLQSRGQAMVEILVAAMFILIPLYIAIVAVGKLIDVQHTTDMAARYATWERTVWYEGGDDFASLNAPNRKSAGEINNEVVARLLSDRSGTASVIRSSDKTASTLVNGIDPMWHDIAGTAYLANFSEVAVTVGSQTPNNDVSAGPLQTVGKVPVNGSLSFAPPLPTDNLATVQVSLNGVGRDSQVYQRLWSDTAAWTGVDFQANGAILSNTWAANGNGATRSMVARAVPTAQGLGAVIDAAKTGLAPWDAVQPARIETGKINVDVVPQDRLK